MGLETFLDPGDRKFIIEDQLEKEINKVNKIKENVEKSNQITKGIVDILNSFEHRLAKLEETILPVYNETGNLQRQQQNIEKVMSLLDHVIGYYSVAEDVADTIKAGPCIKGLDEYLISLNKLKGAQSYFEKNNPQSVELENVSSLYSKGVETLLREFQELLVKHSRPLAPITLLDLIATDEDVSEDGSVGSVGTLLGGENVAAELATMAAWLVSEGRLELLKNYASVRASVMLRSVNNLKDHHKSNSKGSTHNMVSPSLSMRIPKSKGEGSGRKRLQAVLEKKANKMLLKASQTLENSTGLSIGGRRSNLFLESKELAVEESEMESYLVCVMGVQRLMTTERNLMSTVIPSSHHNPVYQNIIQDSLAVIVADGENIAERAKRCISRKDFGSVLVIFPILKNLLCMRPEFDRAVEGCDYNIRSQFTNILNILHATAGKALEEIVESLRGDGTGLPRDGTVHELTSNTLVTIAQLTEFSTTIAQVLARDPAYQAHPLRNHPDQTSTLLSLYIRKVLSELNCTLMSKSEVYPDAGVKALFRLNNAHHVLKALQRSNLLDLVAISEPDCEATYLALMTSHKQAYQTSWNKLVAYITSTEDIVITPGRVKDKDRSTIKERFLGFNKEMEDIVKLQRSYSVPDVELRQSLKRDNKEYILPLYNKFYNNFSTVPFTKNPEKYVKYSPDQVASMIDRFFDVAA